MKWTIHGQHASPLNGIFFSFTFDGMLMDADVMFLVFALLCHGAITFIHIGICECIFSWTGWCLFSISENRIFSHSKLFKRNTRRKQSMHTLSSISIRLHLYMRSIFVWLNGSYYSKVLWAQTHNCTSNLIAIAWDWLRFGGEMDRNKM